MKGQCEYGNKLSGYKKELNFLTNGITVIVSRIGCTKFLSALNSIQLYK